MTRKCIAGKRKKQIRDNGQRHNGGFAGVGERQKVGGRAAEQPEIGLTMPRFIRSQNPIYGRLAKADLDSDGSSGSALGG